MPGTPKRGAPLRLAAFWLLVVAVFMGPLGLGSSVAAAAACSCEDGQAADAEHEGGDCSDDGSGARDHESHEPDTRDAGEVDDECPECSCCPGVAVGLVSVLIPTLLDETTSLDLREPADAPEVGDASGVFRPPRNDA